MNIERHQKERLQVRICPMLLRDIPEVLQIEQESFYPCWREKDFFCCLPKKPEGRRYNYTGVVAYIDEKIVGFMVYELHEDRIQLLNFVVSFAYRRKSIGSQMIARLASKLASKLPTNRKKISLMVRDHNVNAQLFFRAQDFKATKPIRNHYKDHESAIPMEYCLYDDVNCMTGIFHGVAQCGE